MKKKRKEIRHLRHYVVKHTTFTSDDVRKFSKSRLFYIADRIFDVRSFKRELFGWQSGSDFVTQDPLRDP